MGAALVGPILVRWDLDGGVGFLAFLAPWLVGGRPSLGSRGRWASRRGLGLRPWFPRLGCLLLARSAWSAWMSPRCLGLGNFGALMGSFGWLETAAVGSCLGLHLLSSNAFLGRKRGGVNFH